jgi:asparagine synthetase B (glutamine-hydrolysing)
MIDKLIINAIDKESNDKDVAVLLSGGVDSLSVAFAASRLNKNITAYTFHLKDDPSYDAKKAIEVSKKFNWKCRVIEIPTDNLKQDFQTLTNEIKCVKKTHYECCFPFLYVYPQITEKEVLSGWAADGYYGISKKAILHYTKGKPKSKFDEFRDIYFSENNRAGYLWHKKIADKYNKKFITPYLDETIKEFFYKMDWYELNVPFQKHNVVTAFKEFTKFNFSSHINLQLGAKIDKLFETLLIDKKINFKNRKRVMDICRDWSTIAKSTGILPV